MAMSRKKLFRITEELMYAANVAVLPTHSEADFFDDKNAKSHPPRVL